MSHDYQAFRNAYDVQTDNLDVAITGYGEIFGNRTGSPDSPLSSCSNTLSIRDNPYWTSRKNSLELIELSSINKVSLV